ncbi:MAG: hypothetical protein RLZZ399_741 [Verrucomicrobiota bacterium]|jgi:hypothetical protein
MRSPLSLILLASAFLISATSALARDLTFYLVSDVHTGMVYKQCEPPFTAEEYNQHVVRTLDVLATLPGRPWPTKGPLFEAMKGKGPVPAPKAMIVAGDLTEAGSEAQWKDFDQLFPWQGAAPRRFPVIALAGNHDGGSKTGAIRKGLRERNQAMVKAGMLSRLSEDSLHSAWEWQGIHFINVNLYPGDVAKTGAKPGSMWDPEKSLSFLKDALATIKPVGAPVVIVQHFDYGARSQWWDQERRKAFYEVIRNANVVALLHGHTHAISKLTFPEDEDYAAFGDGGPRFDCFSAGAFKREDVKKELPFPGPRNPCECYVFRIIDDTFAAGHFTGGPEGWNASPKAGGLTVVKKISPGGGSNSK